MTKPVMKKIECTSCFSPLEVPKWSGNKQECDRCKELQPKLAAEFNREVDEAHETHDSRPVDKLRHAQEILGALGFAITSRGWHKQYQDGNAVVRLEPFFDTGTSMEPGHALEGFTVVRQEFVAVVDRELAQKLPGVAHADVTTLLQELEMKLPGISLNPTHVDMVRCSKCGDETAEWIQLVNSKDVLCVSRCAPVKRKFRD